MPKTDLTETLRIRIDKTTKDDAERVLGELGVNPSDAVRMFYRYIILHDGIPFEVRIPNAETVEAIEELDSGGGKSYTTVAEMFADLEG